MSNAFFSALAERFRELEQPLNTLGGASRAAARTPRLMQETFA